MTHSSKTAPRPPCKRLLVAALDYHRRGWSIVPMAMAKKRPARKWTCYQSNRASEAQVQAWFGKGPRYGIGVVFGAVSRGLASRDFDTLDAYEKWADAHPDLAKILPTVETRRGRHVYCIATAGSIEAIRAALGKPNGTGAIAFDDGELRAGVGCYSMLPPSVHPSGHVYRWEIAPGDEIPVVDLQAAGFVGTLAEGRNAATEKTEQTEQTEAMSEAGSASQLTFAPLPQTALFRSGSGPVSGSGFFSKLEENSTDSTELLLQSALSAPFSPSALSSLLHKRSTEKNGQDAAGNLPEAIEAAIRRALPTRPGERNRRIFQLARELKAIAALASAQAGDLLPFVRRWHELASPLVTTKPWDDTWFDFLHAWRRVKYPAGQEPVALAFERAAAADPPEAARQFERPEIRLLVALCRELQRAAGDAPFFLDARTAGKLFQSDHTTAWRWLRGLCDCGILGLEAAGDFAAHRASRYRYLGPL